MIKDKMRCNKKAQFFIIAAVLLVAVISGLALTINYAKTNPSPERFYSVAENYFKECANAIDYGFVEQESKATSPEEQIDEFTLEFLIYLAYVDPLTEVIYVYGNEKQVIVMNYADFESSFDCGSQSNIVKGGKQILTGELSMNIGPVSFRRSILEKLKKITDVSGLYEGFKQTLYAGEECSASISEVIVTMQKNAPNNKDYKQKDSYKFEGIGKDPKFFVIIRTQRYGETYVFSNKLS